MTVPSTYSASFIIAVFSFGRCLLLLVSFSLLAPLHAQSGGFFQREAEIVVVTDMTEAGRKRAPVSPENPVYYQGKNLGYRDFAFAVAGTPPPPTEKEVEAHISKLLAKQGYLGATPDKPASLYIMISYGTLNQEGGPRLAANGMVLSFLGGDKLGLMWEAEDNPFVNPGVLRRGTRDITSSKTLEASAESLFIATVKAFDYADLKNSEKITLLWVTKIACPSRGLTLNDTLKLMLEIAAPSFGKESKVPVWTQGSEFRQTRVEIGEAQVLEQWETKRPSDKPAQQPNR